MSELSESDAYSYAKFLVDIYPDDAIEILCRKGSCDIIELVMQQVNRNCIKLGGGSTNKIKGMVEERRWDELKTLRGSPTHSASATPRQHRRGEQRPPTPSSMASGSPQALRNPSHDWISVFQCDTDGSLQFTASPSGSEEYLIGEDKLERFHSVSPEWATPTKKITLGGQIVDVSQHVNLTWARPGDRTTEYNKFWVVRPELIRHADVLLGHSKHLSRGRQNKGAVDSPLSLDSRHVAPPAPTPPQLGVYKASSATSIHSVPDASSYKHGRPPYPTAGGFPNMRSGPPSLSNLPPTQRTASATERESPRSGSASSTGTRASSRPDIVVVQLSFEGMGNRRLTIDLSSNGDEIIPQLEPHIRKISNGKELDRSIHEVTIVPSIETISEPASASLGEDGFEHIWKSMVQFMREHRSDKSPEFLFRIGID